MIRLYRSRILAECGLDDMKHLFVTISVAAALALSVGAQETPPNAPPSPTTKSGSTVGKLDSQEKTKDSDQEKTKPAPIPFCAPCPNCCPVEQPQSKSKEEQIKEDSLDLLYRRYLRATIWGVLGAWIGLIVLIIQTILSRQSSQREQRAYVMSESSYIVNVANPLPVGGKPAPETLARIVYPNGPIAHMRIQNTGKTPAFEVRNWGDICIKEHPLRSQLPTKPAGLNANASILGPGIISTKRFTYFPLLTPKETSDLMAGTIAIYVYGEITYRDVFKKQHFTRYRLMHHIMGGVIGVSTDLSFAEDGNEAN